jgi:hypothetical protein
VHDFDIPKGTPCAKSCGREAKEWYADNISAMDIAHGYCGKSLCRHCIIENKLKYANKIQYMIPELRKELLNLEFKEAQK